MAPAITALSSALAADLPTLYPPELRNIQEDDSLACLRLTLSEASDLPGSVYVTTSMPEDLTPAIPHEDYLPLGGRLEFPPGATEQDVCITILDDEEDKFAGFFLLVLSDPVNLVLNSDTVEFMIDDNDGPTSLAVSQFVSATSVAPGVAMTFNYRVSSKESITEVGRTARLDVVFDPPAAISAVEVMHPPIDPSVLIQTSCGELGDGAFSCTIRNLQAGSVTRVELRVTTAADFRGVLGIRAVVNGVRGTTNTNPNNVAGTSSVLVASPVWLVHAPIIFGVYDFASTGLKILNTGPGNVQLRLSGGPERDFPPGIEEWWFPIGGGHYVVNATSSSGPCVELTYYGGNTYNIPIDFKPGELRRLSFTCMDTSRPPDGTNWTLYYYLEPIDSP
jgi:hypothetical protein